MFFALAWVLQILFYTFLNFIEGILAIDRLIGREFEAFAENALERHYVEHVIINNENIIPIKAGALL